MFGQRNLNIFLVIMKLLHDEILIFGFFFCYIFIYHYQVNYGNFMHGLMKENIQLNRKVLSEISMHEPYSFKALVDISRNAFPGNKNVVHRPRKVDISSVNV